MPLHILAIIPPIARVSHNATNTVISFSSFFLNNSFYIKSCNLCTPEKEKNELYGIRTHQPLKEFTHKYP